MSLRQLRTYFLLGISLFFSFLMFRIVIPYFSFDYNIGFLLTKQSILHISLWRYAFYTHISSSLFVLLFGAFQFIKVSGIRIIKIHRLLGKIYVILILFISAPSGLIMAFYANGGLAAKISFVIVSLLWWYFTFMAYQKIRKKNIVEHQAFMYRSYALTLSAITLRIYALTLPLFIHLSAKGMYTLIAWGSWIPNLIAAEIIIRYLKRKRLNLSVQLLLFYLHR